MMMPGIPACTEARSFIGRMLAGEARGALGYVVPLVNREIEVPRLGIPESAALLDRPDTLLELRLRGLARRRWGHDHGVPMLNPTIYPGCVVASAFGSRYHCDPVGTVPAVTSADGIESLPLDVTLADGLIPKALAAVEYFARHGGGRVPIERHLVNGPTSLAGLIVKNVALLEAFYTHPRAVRRLLARTTEMFAEFVQRQQQIVPDLVLEGGMHDTWLPKGYALVEDDLVMALSPEMALDFVVPCYNRLSEVLGGIVLHSCGDWSHHFEMLKRNVPGLRGIWFNVGECSFQRAVEVFRGTDVVLIPRWPLAQKYPFASRLDFVRQILAAKTPDVSVFLQAHYFRTCREDDENAVSQEILRVIERYLRTGEVDAG